jgi:hypothetical protein
METKIYYLNNEGSRMVERPNRTYFIRRYPSNEIIQRKGKYFYTLGNFVGIAYNYKGKTETSCNFSLNRTDLD